MSILTINIFLGRTQWMRSYPCRFDFCLSSIVSLISEPEVEDRMLITLYFTLRLIDTFNFLTLIPIVLSKNLISHSNNKLVLHIQILDHQIIL